MKRWKRAVIWLATFSFGLVWVLAFLLPTEIGGGIDRHGMYAPDLVGSRLYYTTGVRATSQPLQEHTQGAQIVSLDLRDTSKRTLAFSSSVTRRDDYNGAKRPQVWRDQSGYHMLYIGLGADDRNRVCQADSADGIRFTPRSGAVFEAPESVSAEGPQYISLSLDRQTLHYIVSIRGRGVVRAAVWRNGRWEDGGVRRADADFASFCEHPESSAAAALVEGGGGRELLTGALNLPLAFKSVFAAPQDLRLKAEGGFRRLLVVGGNPGDPRLHIALYEGATWEGLQLAQGAQSDGTVCGLGSPAQSTLIDGWAAALSNFVPVVSAFAFGMGLLSLLGIHGRRLRKGGEPAVYSLIVLAAMTLMLVVQLRYAPTKPEVGVWHDLNDLLFFRLQFPLTSTTFGLLAAYLVSAAYRAFRIRTVDAAVLGLTAAFIILTQVPTGQFLAAVFAPGFVDRGAAMDLGGSEARNWALTIANDAVQRAVGFGAFVGAIAMAMRVWLTLDRTAAE
jgi:hypothetical protein